jgi:hypothetical protein
MKFGGVPNPNTIFTLFLIRDFLGEKMKISKKIELGVIFSCNNLIRESYQIFALFNYKF